MKVQVQSRLRGLWLFKLVGYGGAVLAWLRIVDTSTVVRWCNWGLRQVRFEVRVGNGEWREEELRVGEFRVREKS